MKGAGSLREPGRRKHRTSDVRSEEERSEARDRSESGAFEAVLVTVLFESAPGAFEALRHRYPGLL